MKREEIQNLIFEVVHGIIFLEYVIRRECKENSVVTKTIDELIEKLVDLSEEIEKERDKTPRNNNI